MTTLRFGKFKGMEIADVSKTDQGKSWLNWYLAQEGNPKYKESEDRLKSEIRGILSGGEITPADVTKAFGGQVVGKIETKTPYGEPNIAQYLQKIIILLEEIKTNTEKWVE